MKKQIVHISILQSSKIMRTLHFILLFVCAVGVSLAAETKFRKGQATQANIQSMPFVVEAEVPFHVESGVSKSAGHFTVTARQEDREHNTLQVGALWVHAGTNYGGTNYVSDCLIYHGPVTNGKVIFNFDVATNHYDSSWFVLHYGTSNNWSASYWFYLKDFSHAKHAL